MDKTEVNPMTIEELNSIIDQAEDDSEYNRLYDAEKLLNEINS